MEKLRRKLKSLKDQIPSDDEQAKFEGCWSCFLILLVCNSTKKRSKESENK